VPVGAVLLIRDVNAKLTRLVAQKDQLRVVEATAYGNFFELLQDAHFKAARAKAEERKLAAIAAQTQPAATSAL
jgi:hypothetical protein